jgi:deoxyribodipyrimidine photolyase-related protein
MANLIVILGDQLSPDISSLKGADPSMDHIMMAEVRTENTYVAHHKKKMVFILSAMRHFAKSLKDRGFEVHYTFLNDPDNTHQLCTEVLRRFENGNYDRVIVTEASEYRVLSDFKDLQNDLPCLEILEDDRFICTKGEFKKWTSGRKQLRMEYFYREMRKKTGLLM